MSSKNRKRSGHFRAAGRCSTMRSRSPTPPDFALARRTGARVPAALAFWRAFARRFFQAVCHLGEGAFEKWAAVAPPDDTELTRLAIEAPPMRGLEYLDIVLLRRSWEELRELVATQAATFAGGPGAYLHSVTPVWNLLGRVTFHLAENKRDPQRPFAFLATYTHQMGRQGQVQHLPLADALRTYAGAKDQDKLAALLAPVRRASQRSDLVRGLLDSRTLFSPQAWTIAEAYRFLVDSAAIEEAGVVVRVPNWWAGSRPRPQVQVQIGARPSAELGWTGARLPGRCRPRGRTAYRAGASAASGRHRRTHAASRKMGRGRSRTTATGSRSLEERWNASTRTVSISSMECAARRLRFEGTSWRTTRLRRGPDSFRATGCAKRSNACARPEITHWLPSGTRLRRHTSALPDRRRPLALVPDGAGPRRCLAG